MNPLLDSRSHGLRPVRDPLVSGALQQRGQKFLTEANGHDRPRPPPDWGSPRSRAGQMPEVVTGLSLVSPGLDLLVTHATPVEKVPTHGNIVYETRSRSLPPTATLDSQTPPPSQTTTPRSDGPRMLLNRYQRSTFVAPQTALCQPVNLQPRIKSTFKMGRALRAARTSPPR